MTDSREIVRYGDDAMYESQPMNVEEGTRVSPRVFLLSGTADPLGNLAADMRMYRGDPVYSLAEITDEQRKWAWAELSKTKLNTPLEGVQLKFMIEAVTRSFTHQMVRQRVGAYYVQESLRFAVKKGIAKECALPPHIITQDEANESLVHAVEGTEASDVWHSTIQRIEEAYHKLIELGIPAEDARGLLPHCVTTRIIYTTNLRALFEVAGNRLCTQAQFEWRAVFIGMMKAIGEYKGSTYSYRSPWDSSVVLPEDEADAEEAAGEFLTLVASDDWQWELIARPTPMTFSPICYKLGKCAFMSELDRGCTIRDRVNEGRFNLINPEEWMANANAGVTTEKNVRPPA